MIRFLALRFGAALFAASPVAAQPPLSARPAPQPTTLPNLVANPSFEEFTATPREISELNLASPWRSLATSGNEPAELFATGSPVRVGVPQNFNGTEPAHDGGAYAGFIPFSKMDDERYREFLVAPLVESLEAGCTYRAACFVSLAERAHWAVDGIQMLFSARGPLLIEQGYVRSQPQVSAPGIIAETQGWTEISGMFRASGGEKLLTVGNFQLSEDTGARRRMARGKDKDAGDIAYYYLDDISVVKVMEADGSPARPPVAVVVVPPVAVAPVAAPPAPPALLGPLPVPKKGQVVRLENVYFASDEARLLPTSAPALDQLVVLLTVNPTFAITIGGHTDDTNTEYHNQLLSRERAEAVRQYLISKRIAPKRLTAVGYGDTQPVADNRTPEGRERNRRVEFTVK